MQSLKDERELNWRVDQSVMECVPVGLGLKK